MPSSLFLFLLFTVALTTTTTHLRRLSAVDPLSPPPANPRSTPRHLPLSALPTPPPVSTQLPPPPQSPPEYIQQEELKNIIDALIGAGDFAAWANILFNRTTNSSTTTAAALIPTAATMFVPRNEALAHLTATATAALIRYHILPQRLTFSELQLFKTLTRFPTLLPSKTIIITNNTPANFTIDGALIVQPDVYLTPAVCVHGIGALLDYTVYSDDDETPASGFRPPTPAPAPSLPLPTTIGGESESSPEPKYVIVRKTCGTICVVERIELVVILVIVWTLNLLMICLHIRLNFS